VPSAGATFPQTLFLVLCEADEVHARACVRAHAHQQGGVHTWATDQISFYDESLKIEGSFVSDGKSIHVSSAYGVKSFPYNDLGAIIDYNAQVLLVKKLLSKLARDPSSGKFKDLQQQTDDQQLPPMQRGGSNSCRGGGGSGANP
jgi:hypothetical protein